MVSNWFSDLWDVIVENIINLICSLFASGISNLYENGSKLYDNCAGKAVDILTRSSKSMAPGAFAHVQSMLTTGFVSLGLLLCTIAFFVALGQESLEGLRDKRYEAWIKRIIMYILATGLTASTPTIMSTLDTWGGAFAGFAKDTMGGEVYTIADASGSYDSDIESLLDPFTEEKDGKRVAKKDADGNIEDGVVGTGFFGFLIAILYFLSTIICGMIILYQAYTRFFKMLIAIPYAGLGFGALCGGHELKRTFDSYLRYVLSIQIAAGTMVMILVIVGSLMTGANAPKGLFGADGTAQLFLEKIFMCFCGVGLVRSADQLTERMLGLH
ncbi:MAG: hypothetical protein E7222_12825 [Clostridiales bacterium]|nr:hypothetical protein [Clostridiales bacterium]